MKKQLLLAAAAVSAIAFAGAANAASLSYRAGTNAVVDTTAAGQYLLARELNFGTGVTSTVGQFDTVVVFNDTGIPAGTYNFTVTYDTGATINAALSGSTVSSTGAVLPTDPDANIGAAGVGFVQVSGAGASLALTSGGQAGGNTATYTLIVPAGVTVKSIAVAAALRVTGAVQVSTNIINQTTNTAFEPGFSKLPLINVNGVGFATRINGAITADTSAASLDTRILEGTAAPYFSTLSTDNRVGQIQLAAASAAGNLNGFGAAFGGFSAGGTTSPIVYKDLTATTVSLSDVTQQSTTIQGNLANLRFTSTDAVVANAPAAPVLTAVATSGTTTRAEPTNTAHNLLTLTPNELRNITVAPNGITATNGLQLAPTELVATTQLFLKPEFSNPAAVSGNFEQLQSDGFTYIIPWVSSATQAGATGNQTIIRISNINPEIGATANGRVYAHLLNPINRAGVTNVGRTVRLADLDANNELVINSATLEAAFGNFQRADLRLVISTRATDVNKLPGGGAAGVDNGVGASSIVVKRLLANSAGGLSEVSVVAGDFSSPNNLPVNQGTGY